MPLDNPPNILLVDDHKMVAAGLARLLSAHYCVTIASNLAEMQKQLAHHKFDLVLQDLQMNDGNPCKCYRDAASVYKLPILIVASTISDAELLQCYRDGVCGYVSKDLSEEEFTQVTAAVLRGEDYWLPEIRQRIKGFKEEKPKVSKRFLPIIRHLLAPDFLSYQEIAELENLTIRTVNNYLYVIFQLYKVGDRLQLTTKLKKMGYTQHSLPE